MGVCFLESLGDRGYFVSPFELPCGQVVSILLDKVDFLFVVSAPKVKAFIQAFIEIRFAAFSDKVIFPECSDILPDGQWGKGSNDGVTDAIVIKIPFSAFVTSLRKLRE